MLLKRRNIVILAIIIFMCSFLNIVNVNAAILDETYIINENIFDSDSYNTIISGSRVSNINYYMDLKNKNKFDNFDSYVKSLNYKYYIYDTDYIYLWNSDDIKIYFTGVYDSTNGSNFSFRLINNNNESYAKISLYSYLYSNSTTITNYSNKIEYLGLFIHATSSSPYSYFSTFNSKCYSNKQLQYFNFVGFDTNSNIYYLGNDIYEPSLKVYNSVIINNILYNDGDLVYSLGPTLNSYSNSFDTTNIDYIKVKLDVNDIIDSDGSVEFDYSLNNYVLDGITDDLPYPYIETIYLDTSEETNIDFMQYRTDTFDSYSDSMAINLLQDLNTTVYYNFVIDTRNYNDILELNFNSYLGYEVVLYYSDGTTEVKHTTGTTSATDTYTSSTVTINLNNYEGIVLMPKVYSSTDSFAELYQHGIHYNQDYTIFLNGIYDIFVYTNPGNYVTLTDTYKSYENNYFTYNFGYVDFIDDKNTNYMKIVKVSSADITDYTITIDTNMFTYSLIENITDNIIVDDANIPGEKINTGTVEESYKLYDANQSLSDVDSSIDKVTNFINDMKECMLIFSDLITFTFNSLNSYCQNFIIVTFIILIVVGIILILRR